MADSPDVRALLLPSVEQISDSDDAVMEPDTVASPPRDVSESESFSPPCGLESTTHASETRLFMAAQCSCTCVSGQNFALWGMH